MTVVDSAALNLAIDLSDGPRSPARDTVSTSTGSMVSSRRDPRAIARAVLFAAPTVLAVLAVWFLLYGLVLSGMEQHVSQFRLYDEFRVQLASETAPLAEPVQVGSPVAMIDAPSIGIHNLIVVEGTTSRLLMSGPGHLSDTPLPGQAGTSRDARAQRHIRRSLRPHHSDDRGRRGHGDDRGGGLPLPRRGRPPSGKPAPADLAPQAAPASRW